MTDDSVRPERLEVESWITPAPGGDLDLLDRTRREHRRRLRALGAVLVVAVVAGPLAGTAIERSRNHREAPLAVDTDSPAPERAAASSSTGDAATGSLELDVAGGQGLAGDWGYGGPGGYWGSGGYWGEPLERLGTATVGDLTVRLYGATHPVMDDGNPFWNPPPGCYAIGSLSIQVSTPGIASALWMERFANPERPDGTVQLVGVPEGEPRWIVVAEVGTDQATVTFPDGQVAEGTAVGGILVASAPAPGYADTPMGDEGHQATVAAGGASHTISSWSYPSEEFYRDHCQPPPPSLPEPGEQPTDAGAASDEVRAALTTVFGTADLADKVELVQHPDVIVPAQQQLAANYPDLAVETTMHDLVFVSPTSAYFIYDLDAGIARFDHQIGEAMLVDDRWIIATETVCHQLRKGGATCEVPAD